MTKRSVAIKDGKLRVRWPGWMQRETAAAYCDQTLRTFDLFVRRGWVPAPRKMGDFLLWSREEIDSIGDEPDHTHVDPYDEGIRLGSERMEAEKAEKLARRAWVKERQAARRTEREERKKQRAAEKAKRDEPRK